MHLGTLAKFMRARGRQVGCDIYAAHGNDLAQLLPGPGTGTVEVNPDGDGAHFLRQAAKQPGQEAGHV